MSIDDRLREGLRLNGGLISEHTESALVIVERRRRRWLEVRAIVVAAALVAVVLIAVPLAIGRFRGTPAEPVSRLASGLVGTWSVDVPATAGDVTGRWLIRVSDGGAVELVPPASLRRELTSGSSITVSADTLETNVFLGYPGCQLPGAVVGQYRWVRSGATVAFTVISDGCRPRRALFSVPWVLT
jgi:hypothetical protein